VWVVVTHDVTHHAGTLRETAIWSVAAFEHRIQNPPVNWLQAIANIRQRPTHDDTHRIIEIRARNFGLDVDWVDAPAVFYYVRRNCH
jgi:hypothetical protein